MAYCRCENSEARKCGNTNRASIEQSDSGNIDMNNVAKTELTFHNVTFTPVKHSGQIWLTSSELAKALEYKKSDAVTQIYSRYQDEFTDSMSTTLKMSVVRKTGAVDIPVRVFSLRGAHLIAMFANTPVAKEFRRWVLDILDREVAENENASPVARHFNCRVLYSFDSNGTVISAQQARDDEFLTSPKMFAERLRKKGYSLVKMEDFTSISLS